jgi:2'-5' RNA ligase
MRHYFKLKDSEEYNYGEFRDADVFVNTSITIMKMIEKESMKTLYVSRPLKNAEVLMDWAAKQGFKKTIEEDQFHVTIAFSREKIDWDKLEPQTEIMTVAGGKRLVEPLGDEGAVVLKFKSTFLPKRWQEIKDAGASWDYEGYTPHVTITYKGTDIDLSKVEPYTGELVFGQEVFTELDENWSADKE